MRWLYSYRGFALLTILVSGGVWYVTQSNVPLKGQAGPEQGYIFWGSCNPQDSGTSNDACANNPDSRCCSSAGCGSDTSQCSCYAGVNGDGNCSLSCDSQITEPVNPNIEGGEYIFGPDEDYAEIECQTQCSRSENTDGKQQGECCYAFAGYAVSATGYEQDSENKQYSCTCQFDSVACSNSSSSTGGESSSTESESSSSESSGPVCGDGNVDEGEECDSGDTEDTTDGCLSDCTLAACNDGEDNDGDGSTDSGDSGCYSCGSGSACSYLIESNSEVGDCEEASELSQFLQSTTSIFGDLLAAGAIGDDCTCEVEPGGEGLPECGYDPEEEKRYKYVGEGADCGYVQRCCDSTDSAEHRHRVLCAPEGSEEAQGVRKGDDKQECIDQCDGFLDDYETKRCNTQKTYDCSQYTGIDLQICQDINDVIQNQNEPSDLCAQQLVSLCKKECREGLVDLDGGLICCGNSVNDSGTCVRRGECGQPLEASNTFTPPAMPPNFGLPTGGIGGDNDGGGQVSSPIAATSASQATQEEGSSPGSIASSPSSVTSQLSETASESSTPQQSSVAIVSSSVFSSVSEVSSVSSTFSSQSISSVSVSSSQFSSSIIPNSASSVETFCCVDNEFCSPIAECDEPFTTMESCVESCVPPSSSSASSFSSGISESSVVSSSLVSSSSLQSSLLSSSSTTSIVVAVESSVSSSLPPPPPPPPVESSSSSSSIAVSSLSSESSKSSSEATSASSPVVVVQQAACGNGIFETGEQCEVSYNTCSGARECDESICTCLAVESLPGCGNGVFEADEQCEVGYNSCAPGRNCDLNSCTCLPTGTNVSNASSTARVLAMERISQIQLVAAAQVCGDGQLAPPEECDDANQRDGDGCSSSCLLEVGICGDGIVQQLLGEQCEQGGQLPAGVQCQRCRYVSTSCGNGTVDAGEECDDGALNSTNSDANCRPDCSVSRCGDGILDSVEQCDDGNRLGNDGCDRYCLNETETTVLAASTQSTTVSEQIQASAPVSIAFNQQPVAQTVQFPNQPTFQQLPFQLPLAQLAPLTTTQPPIGDTGPAAVAVIAAGAAAGFGYIRRKRK